MIFTQQKEFIVDSAIQVIPLDWTNASGNNNGEIGFSQTTDATSALSIK